MKIVIKKSSSVIIFLNANVVISVLNIIFRNCLFINNVIIYTYVYI